MNTNSKQMITGKSFEFAILREFEEKLMNKTNVEIIENSAFEIARDCFENISSTDQSRYLLSASFAVNFLMDIEPRLSNDISNDDILQLEILSDTHGVLGDVRDVLIVRLVQKWEIGISAKNNHNAVKHSRLSSDIDFGDKWVGVNVSEDYFNIVRPIFEDLREIRKKSNAKKKWKELGDYHKTVYIPILTAFMNELQRIHDINPEKISENLISYLVGKKDFYKVIQRKKSVEVHAYNLYNTLNLQFKDIKPKFVTPLVKFPTKILDISFKDGSDTTVIVKFNNEWVLAFRIHNASSRVEPSLKFDINLLESPKSLFKNILDIN